MDLSQLEELQEIYDQSTAWVNPPVMLDGCQSGASSDTQQFDVVATIGTKVDKGRRSLGEERGFTCRLSSIPVRWHSGVIGCTHTSPKHLPRQVSKSGADDSRRILPGLRAEEVAFTKTVAPVIPKEPPSDRPAAQ